MPRFFTSAPFYFMMVVTAFAILPIFPYPLHDSNEIVITLGLLLNLLLTGRKIKNYLLPVLTRSGIPSLGFLVIQQRDEKIPQNFKFKTYCLHKK